MKIAFVCPDDLSTLIFCKRFSATLSAVPGTEVLTVSPVDRYASEIDELASKHVDVPMSRFISPWRDTAYFWRLFRLFRRERPDVVITFTTKPNIYATTAARLAGVSTVLMAIRGLGRCFLENRSLRGRVLRGVVSTLYRLAARASTKVWFTNPGDREFFVTHRFVAEDRTLLTRNALNLDDFAPAAIDPRAIAALRDEFELDASDRVVIMVARLIWPKGVREFAEAAAAVHDELPRVHFFLVAPLEADSPAAVPESFIREAESRSRLRWLGFRKDVRELYALADLAVLPSYYKEGGYPRALIEPMALGKPAIAADTDDCREPVVDGENGFLVPPRDGPALAEAVRRIFADDEQRERFGAASLARVRRDFDDRHVVAQVLVALGIGELQKLRSDTAADHSGTTRPVA